MKKILTISIVTVTMVIQVTCTTAVPVAGTEPAVDVPVADENIAEMMKVEFSNVISGWRGFTVYEIMAIYPGYLEYLWEAQAQDMRSILEQLP